MRIIEVESYEKMSALAADVIAAQVITKPSAVLGFATGSTPVGTYAALAQKCQNDGLDFSQITTFNLDEYCALEITHPQSYYAFMWENLFSHINIKKENVHLPNGMAENIDAECESYECMIEEAGGVDLQLLGIGHNGHIGFNEPGDAFISATHRVDLTQRTIEANCRFFENDLSKVPKQAITMGIGTIMKAKSILMLIRGEDKLKAMKAMLAKEVHPSCQASVLQYHPNVTVIYTAN